MKQWYEELFQNYGRKYDAESYTQGTVAECDFFEQELAGNKSARILDIGCGTGRHAIELAKRGYSVTGVDLSEAMLTRARQKAAEVGTLIDFQRADARHLIFEQQFELAIMICEGAFPLMETDEMNFAILENAAKALTRNGKLILTTLNGLFPLFHSVKDFLNTGLATGTSIQNSFDLMTFRDYSSYETEDDSGNKLCLQCNERYYVPPEISWLLKSVGFCKVEIFGATLGAFSRSTPLTTENFEMLVIAEKSATLTT